MRALRVFLYNAFPRFFRLLRNCYTLTIQQGQKQSLTKRASINAKGEPIPWFTYPTIEFLDRFDFSQCHILEFGSGNSTLYWARKAKSITSIEHNPDWFQYIKQYITPNLKVILEEDKDGYVGCLSKFNRLFDVIVVDGKWRHACSHLVSDYLKDSGLIIFDNTDWFPEATKQLRDKRFFQIDFTGFGPINDYCWTTSIFLKANTTIQSNFVQRLPIGGIEKTISEADDDFA